MIRSGITTSLTIIWFATIAAMPLAAAVSNENADVNDSFLSKLPPVETHGFYEIRGGYRLQEDKYQKDMSIMEGRFQFDLFSYLDWGDIKVKGDVIGDMVTEKGDFDLREANIFSRPTDFMDVKVGRQILTWGTGDLIFINDLFPKDWQSFFIGRDTEYLKAPSDAAKVSLFGETANLDIAYTPKFDPDRYPTGERISYWNSSLGRTAGQDAIVHTDKPDDWFSDSEIAARLYKNIDNYELAFYGYHGLRGAVGKGIGNVEIGYYDSADDASGKNPLINNSEMRYLVGYTREIAKDFTMGLQYYIEQMLDYRWACSITSSKCWTTGRTGEICRQDRHATRTGT